MEFIYILMCHYASVYWVFLFALIVSKILYILKQFNPTFGLCGGEGWKRKLQHQVSSREKSRFSPPGDQSGGPTPEPTEGNWVREEGSGGGGGAVEQGDR